MPDLFMDMHLYLTPMFIMLLYYFIQNSEKDIQNERNSERKRESAGERELIYTENSS